MSRGGWGALALGVVGLVLLLYGRRLWQAAGSAGAPAQAQRANPYYQGPTIDGAPMGPAAGGTHA